MKVSRKINWHQIVISLLVGFAIGTAFGQWHAKEHFHEHWKKGSMRQHMLERFNRKLHLTEDQKQQVSKIFDAKHPQMVALQAEMKPKFEALRNSTQVEIRKVLNPDQQAKFDEMNSEKEKHWKDHDRGGFDGPRD